MLLPYVLAVAVAKMALAQAEEDKLKLQVVDFPPGTQIECLGGTYYSAPAGKTPQPSPNSTVLQGAVESSNVNPVTAMVQLVTAQRSAETMQRAMYMFNSEMDKTATQELPKVG